jgi:uncharacterized protein YbaA (DUF1428 family)
MSAKSNPLSRICRYFLREKGVFGDLNLTGSFAKYFAEYTNMSVDIHYIKHAALFDRSIGGKITVAEDIKITDVRDVLYQENAVFKNSIKSKHRENVYFSWSKSNTRFNIAFVDDMGDIERFKTKNHFCLVQTSRQKYQGFFLLNQYVSAEELHIIQKVLCSIYKGDTGALGTWQLKRLPGFWNTKYEPDYLVIIVYRGTNIINVDEVLKYYEQKYTQKCIQKPTQIRRYTATAGKSWQDYKTDDLSQVDMRYTCYLVRIGLSDEEIAKRLVEESENIEQRKGKFLTSYISRTIEKAREYVV